ncbi:5-dehydro-2-deoxygluconokinase [Aeromicrobium sp. CF4.19]|uniref:5-dehydro-2-deoxygluconokinase n=1 Tax=Aeromicrobium sp. CF4.19 TaxID=3373082 RepID=UPI003EE52D2A
MKPADPTVADLVSVGRISVDLYGEQVGSDLGSTSTFRRFVGGSAANIAVGSSRLGLRVAMSARVGDDGFGDYLVAELDREGVDTAGVVRDPERATGTIALAMHEARDFPRTFLVADPAEFALEASDVRPEQIRQARALVLTGTLLSRPGLERAARRALDSAREGGTAVVFDIDYRPAFWGVVNPTRGENLSEVTPEVTERLQTVLADCDVVVGTHAELRALGGDPDLLSSLRRIRELTDALIVCKDGAEGCRAFEGAIPARIDDAVRSPGFAVSVVNSVGAGDAFMSGFLRGYLRDQDLPTCLRWANAAGAVVVGRLGCCGDSPSMSELKEFMTRSAGSLAPVRSTTPAQFQTATRFRDREKLFVFAIDHRGHLERLAQQAGRPVADVATFKDVVLNAFLAERAGDEGAGVLVDDTYVSSATRERINDSGVWNARALEVSGRAPVQFHHEPDVAGFLRSWPRDQVVKVLVVSSPDQDAVLRFTNQERLRTLTEVARNLRRDVLIEILPPPGRHNGARELVGFLDQWYCAGVRPNWWKLPALRSAEEWHEVARLVEGHDPDCRGLLVLGGGTSREMLADQFAAAREEPAVKGFAVGRPIFHDVAVDWFAGRVDDEQAGKRIIATYDDVISTWCRAQSGERVH